jgi:hypothetical protein
MMPSWEEALRKVLLENVRDDAGHLVERLRQLVNLNGPVAPPSPRTANNTHERAQGTELSSDRSYGRQYSGAGAEDRTHSRLDVVAVIGGDGPTA